MDNKNLNDWLERRYGPVIAQAIAYEIAKTDAMNAMSMSGFRPSLFIKRA